VTASRGTVVAMTIALLGGPLAAQDSATVRHSLALDVSRLQPFARSYDMIVHHGDSAAVIGTRTLSLQRTFSGGAEAWLIVETRSGAVPSAESLFVAADFRPVRWSATLGPSRLAAAFTGDSVLGAASDGRWKENVLLDAPPDLLVSASMTEVLLPLLPLSETWSDSVTLLTVAAGRAAVLPAELMVVGVEELVVDSVTTMPAWVAMLRSANSQAMYWIERGSGVSARVQVPLPPHTGRALEFRLSPPRTPAMPPG